MPTYHLFRPASHPLESSADYILAGDGVYGVMECFGMRIPVPLLPCEIRGLPALFPTVYSSEGDSSDNAEEMSGFGPGYHILSEECPTIPSVDPTRMYQYMIAREGVFLLAGCPALEILMPISALAKLPGLASVTPFLHFVYPLVDEDLVCQMLDAAKAVCDEQGQPIEQLYYLLWDRAWRLALPEQEASETHVRAKSVTMDYLDAVIEGHSHHRFRARFSSRDDLAEVADGGFRIYFVLGNLFAQPEIRTRVCIHGYEWEVPASLFFSLPEGLIDCVAQEWEVSHDPAHA